MGFLEGLVTIDWSAFHHAYGPATDVPEFLLALVNPETAPPELKSGAEGAGRSVLEHVEWILYGNVFHQGSVW